MSASNAARFVARKALVTRPQVSATRRYATDVPPPLPEKKSSNTLLIVGALAAAGAGGYYYLNQTGKEEDVAQKARELDHAARVQASKKIDEGKERFAEAKADGRAKIDSASSSIQSTYNSAIDKTSAAAHDAQARLGQYKDSASASLHQAKDETEKAAAEAKAKTSSSWSSWLGWGKGKAEETKSEAAHDAAAGFRVVKDEAKKGERAAEKRV